MIVTIHAHRRHALRSTGIFLAAAAAWAIVAGAVLSAILIVREELQSPSSVATQARPDIKADGLVVLNPLSDRGAFKDALGFEPVVPETLPDTTSSSPLFFSISDSSGQVRFAPRSDTTDDGLRGAAIALTEQRHTEDEAVDRTVKTAVTGTTRIVSTSLVCGGITVQAQLYFYSSTSDAPGAETVTPRVDAFLAALGSQCSG